MQFKTSFVGESCTTYALNKSGQGRSKNFRYHGISSGGPSRRPERRTGTLEIKVCELCTNIFNELPKL